VVLNLIDSPDGTLDILHTHEALVERQVVPHGVLLDRTRKRQRHAHTQNASHPKVRVGGGKDGKEKKKSWLNFLDSTSFFFFQYTTRPDAILRTL
jgi:hypothetical protein